MPTLVFAQGDSARYAMKVDASFMTGYTVPHSAAARRILTGNKILTGYSLNLSWQAKGDSVSGLGLEYVYAPIGDDVQHWENMRGIDTPYQDPHGISIVGHHEAMYKNIGIHVGFGYYLKHEPQQYDDPQSSVFETAGLRYYLPLDRRRFYIGYNIRARGITADCFQFAFGYQFGKKVAQ